MGNTSWIAYIYALNKNEATRRIKTTTKKRALALEGK
jgi:hypothetical protein